MAIAYNPTENFQTLSQDQGAGDDILRGRARYLQEALARASSTPNPDPQTLANIASFQSELADLGERLNKSDTQRTLDLFNQNAPTLNLGQETGAINDLFNTQQAQQTQALNDIFAQQRGNAIEEAAAAGNARQPAFMSSTLNNIDAMKAKAIEQLFSSLGIGKAQATLDLGDRARQFGLAKAGAQAGIQQGGNQFGQTLGFNQEQAGTKNTLLKRQQDLDDLFRNAGLAEQVRTRQAGEPSFLDKVQQGSNIFKNVAGGAKDLYGNDKGGGALR